MAEMERETATASKGLCGAVKRVCVIGSEMRDLFVLSGMRTMRCDLWRRRVVSSAEAEAAAGKGQCVNV